MSVEILVGDCRQMLATLPEKSVHCVVTSPPYWGLRSYLDDDDPNKPLELGMERTYVEYIENMVAVFREVRRVLRDDGTLWLNLGDCYATGAGKVGDHPGGGAPGEARSGREGLRPKGPQTQPNRLPQPGLKPKDLVGIPWRVALALQADGWWLRSDVIWAKPNPMTSSVKDRPTPAHEHVFLFAKSKRYFYDDVAIKEPAVQKPQRRNVPHKARVPRRPPAGAAPDTFSTIGPRSNPGQDAPGGMRNKRSVWSISPAQYPEAHFAVMPVELVVPCVLASTSEAGACADCGAPHRRLAVSRAGTDHHRANMETRERNRGGRNDGFTKPPSGLVVAHETTGWEAACECEDADVVPCTVLDPFGGAGTVGVVAGRLGRDAILVELGQKYAAMSRKRIDGDAHRRPKQNESPAERMQRIEQAGQTKLFGG